MVRSLIVGLLLTLTACGSSDDSVFVATEFESKISGTITFFDDGEDSIIQVQDVLEPSESDTDIRCSIGMDQRILPYSYNDDTDQLTLLSEVLTRVSTPDTTPQVDGVLEQVFGVWAFDPTPTSDELTSFITVEIEEDLLTYVNTCRST
ncbi:MAG: hypothetical protein HRU19_09990 [Pseudobacteriovorax sp.]|nr:hypothetical protein [Pseudobacteriovorax sp.]